MRRRFVLILLENNGRTLHYSVMKIDRELIAATS
jgi:hypothetical protein